MDPIISKLQKSPKTTPVRVYLWESEPLTFPNCHVFSGGDGCKLIFGEWDIIAPILQANQQKIRHKIVECDRRRSALPLLPLQDLSARIEPGAILREDVGIGKHAVIMMGAILNIGACVGDGTMVDMGAVLGGRATVGKDCHIGAGAVLAGVIEPAGAKPVTIGDRVFVGANAVILEGITVGNDAVVGAGAIVTTDVPPNAVVVGCPAKIIKYKDQKTVDKTGLTDGLRS